MTVGVINPTNHGEQIIAAIDPGPDAVFELLYSGRTRDAEELRRQVNDYLERGVGAILAFSQFAVDIAVEARGEDRTPLVVWTMDEPEAVAVDRASGLSSLHMTGVLPGFTQTPAEEQRLAWMRDIAPRAVRIYTPYNPADEDLIQGLDSFVEAAESLGLELLLDPITSAEEARTAALELPTDADGVFLFGDRFIGTARQQFYDGAIAAGMPLSGPNAASVTEGALYTYSFSAESIADIMGRTIADIAGGTPVTQIPFEVPEFSLVINRSTAEAIGLEIPDEILAHASVVVR